MKKVFILVSFLFLIIVFSISSFSLKCEIRYGSCFSNQTCLISMFRGYNAHAGECGYYNYNLCCYGLTNSSIKTSCDIENGEIPILALYRINNSHVEGPWEGNYQWKVCGKYLINCSLRNFCLEDETCIASLAKKTNSHIANCDYYPWKICCKVPSPILTNPQVFPQKDGWGEIFNFSVYVQEKNNLDTNVSLWYSYDNSSWIYIDSKIVTNTKNTQQVYFLKQFSCNDYTNSQNGKIYFKFNASCLFGGKNSSEIKNFTLEKDDTEVEYLTGNNSVVHRFETVLLQVKLKDKDRNVYVEGGVPCKFYINDSTFTNYTDSNGICSLYFKPDCSFEIGNYVWKVSVDENSCYKVVNSSNFYLIIKGKLNATITFPTNGTKLYRGNDYYFSSKITDGCNNSINANVNWYNESTLIGSGKNIWWTVPIGDFILGYKNISIQATYPNYDSDEDSVIVEILNNKPFVSKPYYNVSNETWAEVWAGDPIKICCNITDVEDYYTDLIVNLSIKDPFDGWFNYTPIHEGFGKFCHDYKTDETQLGNFSVYCSAIDTENDKTTNSSWFVVWQNATIEMNFNTSEFWWYDWVNLTIKAMRKGGTVMSERNVNVTLEGKTVCKGITDSNGIYSCVFQLPGEVGDYIVKVIVEDKIGELYKKFANATIIEVKPSIGGSEEEIERAKQVSCTIVPQPILNPDGTISIVNVEICTWR